MYVFYTLDSTKIIIIIFFFKVCKNILFLGHNLRKSFTQTKVIG